jgi:ABC transporter substrate binding protein
MNPARVAQAPSSFAPDWPTAFGVGPVMERRTFLAIIPGSLLAAPLAAEAQPAGKLHRLAIVYPAGPVAEMTEAQDPMLRVLFSELRRLGYVEGQTLVVERRSGSGRRESYPDVARETVDLKPDVVFAGSGRMAAAFRATTTTIPIVTVTSDPVALGLAASLARPGGNVTGLTVDAGIEVIGKRLELLKEAVPSAPAWASYSRSKHGRAGGDGLCGRLRSGPARPASPRRSAIRSGSRSTVVRLQ